VGSMGESRLSPLPSAVMENSGKYATPY
jgi:hypothetical protein